ncbi:Organic cation transporter protein [Holothuria leucospilota]|uniref:Organic cation transporter protein n=1 Tax=Holothuria leucospilota TaxID=206669 RepID=A0A9Q1BPQ6_HOLLE|nr:Organic cation transporter protein [Holothuria leucospilota]
MLQSVYLAGPFVGGILFGYLSDRFVQSFVYYGLSLGTSSLGANEFVAFCISGAVEIVAYTASIYTMKHPGIKISTGISDGRCWCRMFGNQTCPYAAGAIRVTVAMIGKFAISTTFSNIYLHTAEIFLNH